MLQLLELEFEVVIYGNLFNINLYLTLDRNNFYKSIRKPSPLDKGYTHVSSPSYNLIHMFYFSKFCLYNDDFDIFVIYFQNIFWTHLLNPKLYACKSSEIFSELKRISRPRKG
ncbi:hypothetical protein BpHYR1_007689 [Brachionus plicatilis]|uniref:Uncharacterized protein n=1 Tax=Brachionus plicatilis TaxID=10195 RepID=A0A3M7SQ37_BRAPC|nr:hypothetical protein BpHYR1_007689 [Brachionus plicatilis]